MAQFMRNAEMRARSDRARHDEALKAAYERGLDAAERRREEKQATRDFQIRKNSRRRTLWYMRGSLSAKPICRSLKSPRYVD